MAKSIFISYSRKDTPIIDAITKLMRFNKQRVFLDRDSINPGEKWKDMLEKAITNCDQLILFWCCHSGKSEWVKKEFELGIKLQKPIVPVLCCDFPTDEKISEFMWLDFRGVIAHQCTKHHKKNPKKIMNPIEDGTLSDIMEDTRPLINLPEEYYLLNYALYKIDEEPLYFYNQKS
ncbi:toll/interleukin-1 receptor domain-containing protein [Catalinimonas sp. 4WD22]|uniref:toll/interleukin-1 receptor domain-containing protein n=1 Tax=Catalinimonas locisalis TaxID=3133978 RepID=UPI0031012C89